MMKKMLFLVYIIFLEIILIASTMAKFDEVMSPTKLKMFVDELPDMPRIKSYDIINGVHVPKSFNIGMYHKKWKFHRDLPATSVFAYGTSRYTATVPGPTIEAVHRVDSYITWQNHLPSKHILPWDPTIPTATPKNGIPTVVHLHGGIDEPQSDGHSEAWFTQRFQNHGPKWSKKRYHYHNVQHPGTMWYHDHAMGLTRVNILAGLMGAYVIQQPNVEGPLGLLYGEEYDRPLVVFDRAFKPDGSIYMNSTGNNPCIHPQWQPEYFGDAIIVNGKAWPYMKVKRRKYRFRIINASNARFFRFFFTNNMTFIHVASDSAYHETPVELRELLLAPSEIADVIADFSKSESHSAILANDAPYPYPSGDPVNEENSKVMKFVINPHRQVDTANIPRNLIKYPSPDVSEAASNTRYIAFYEYASDIDEPTHLYINGKTFEAPVTETPRVGTSEIWNVINLTEDNHPMHIHLGLFVVLEQRELVNVEEFKGCMLKLNDAIKCKVDKYSIGKKKEVVLHEKGWKNVYKMMPGHVTKILVKFSFIHSNESYPFDATAEPGYVYHCHILDHEDNVMMRPLKLIN
ncbi:Multicopper oxidase LPR1 [Capsicum annuum]|uniref:Multicopper oxidase LPR1 n=1 Tax=Capsicum annuum TaxID=4072 RepID=A0A1U8F423_CAPAN|nr:multicopper oxidase LPR1 [Capsicum annuum]KAF3632740.1 Multicopper oxidase LPR1 [Capsicum annuum]PHT67236.1 Multicopper oxidase LPR1 [Capsicum annuum]